MQLRHLRGGELLLFASLAPWPELVVPFAACLWLALLIHLKTRGR